MDKLKVWLIKEGESLPLNKKDRLMRMGLLAEYLDARGHEVTWFSSTYDHGRKAYRSRRQAEVPIFTHARLVLLHSDRAYKKNVSLDRIRYCRKLAGEWKKTVRHMEKPDLILCAYPTMSFADAAVKYGKKRNVPVIVDIRDLWPDIFKRGIPKPFQGLSGVFLFPLEQMARRIMRQASGLTAMTPASLRWGIQKRGNGITDFDRKIFIGYKKQALSDEERKKEQAAWQKKGITENTWNICFIGTMSQSSIDLHTAIEAFQKLQSHYPQMRLVLCGKGDALEEYREKAKDIPGVVFPGWVNNSQMTSLMELSKVGLYPMRNIKDFQDTISNKMIGYMSEGLPVLSSLEGYSKQYITKYNIGLIYREQDVQSLVKAIEALYKNEADREKMGQNAFGRYVKDFDSTIVNQQFEEHIFGVLGKER